MKGITKIFFLQGNEHIFMTKNVKNVFWDLDIESFKKD